MRLQGISRYEFSWKRVNMGLWSGVWSGLHPMLGQSFRGRLWTRINAGQNNDVVLVLASKVRPNARLMGFSHSRRDPPYHAYRILTI